MRATEKLSTRNKGTRDPIFEANPIARGVAPRTWAAEVELTRRSAIGFGLLLGRLLPFHRDSEIQYSGLDECKSGGDNGVRYRRLNYPASR